MKINYFYRFFVKIDYSDLAGTFEYFGVVVGDVGVERAGGAAIYT